MEVVMNRRVFLGSCLFTAMPAMAALAPAKPGPVVQVVTYYPDMPAAAVEKTITNRIERWVNQAPGVRLVTSRSIAGVSIVRVYFRDDVKADSALEITGKLAMGTLPTLPPNTLPPITLPGSPEPPRPVGMLALSGTGAPHTELHRSACASIRKGLSRIKGAVAPATLGLRDSSIRILRLDEKKLQALNLHLEDVIEVLRKNKSKVAYFGDQQILLDSTAEKLDEVQALIVRDGGKQTVRLGDLGTIKDYHPPETVGFRYDGRRAVGMPVFAVEGARPRELRKRIAGNLADLQKRLPEKIKLRWVPFAVESNEDPSGDGLLTLYVRAPFKARLPDTEKRIAAVERLLEKNIPAKEREAILSVIGMTPDWTAAYTANAGPMDATLFVQLSRQRTLSAAQLAAKLRRLINSEPSFADLSFRFASRDMAAPVDVRIQGGKGDEAMRLAQQVQRRLAAIKGTVDVDIAQRMDAPYLGIKVHRDKAAEVGLSSREVLTRVLAALQPGAVPDRNFWFDVKQDTEPFIAIPLPNKKLDDLLNLEMRGPNLKAPIKLSSLATLQRINSAVEIHHVNLSRVLDARANIENRERRDVIADIRKMLAELKVPEGVKVELTE
jgi:multidrug efflux pump subunit AcrB